MAMAEGFEGVRIGWKEGKADGAVARLSTVGWVSLRRFCPTLRVEASAAGLGSWDDDDGATVVGATDGS